MIMCSGTSLPLFFHSVSRLSIRSSMHLIPSSTLFFFFVTKETNWRLGDAARMLSARVELKLGIRVVGWFLVVSDTLIFNCLCLFKLVCTIIYLGLFKYLLLHVSSRKIWLWLILITGLVTSVKQRDSFFSSCFSVSKIYDYQKNTFP